MLHWTFIRKLSILVFSLGIIFSGGSYSTLQADEFINNMESARGLAMGGALTAVASSFDAVLYNPAGLYQTDYWKVEFRSWDEKSYDSKGNSGDAYFDNLESLRGRTPAEINAFIESFGQEEQTKRSFKFAGYHNSTGFGLSMFESTRQNSSPVYLDPAIQPAPDPQLDITYDHLQGTIATLAYGSDLKLFMWGFNLKYLQREGASYSYTQLDISDANFDPLAAIPGNSEYTYDMGILTRLPIPYLNPTFGATMLNVLPADFGIPGLGPVEQETNIGLSLSPIFSRSVRTIFSMDVRDISKTAFPDDQSKRRREHFGFEASLFPQKDNIYLLQLRAGVSQGFTSWGFGANVGHFVSINYANYQEDVGEQTYRIPRKRQLLEFSIGF